MTPAVLAKSLDGTAYPVRVPPNLISDAKRSGLVIVYGASDDLVEFEGAFSDEAGCYEGGTVRFDERGILPSFEDVEHTVEECRKWLARDAAARSIDVLWCKEPGYSWTYRTDIPHSTFEVMEDGEHYCRGIVFALSALKRETA